MSENEPSTSPKKSVTNPDGTTVSTFVRNLKTLDANRYATKKTIAQGLLDVALLTANASQLKYVLQVGKQHEFYVLMLSLIIVSIVLQLVVAILFVIIGGLNINKPRDHNAAIILNDTVQAFLCALLGTALNINKEKDQENANKANNFVLFMNIVIVVINIIISSFHMSDTRTC